MEDEEGSRQSTDSVSSVLAVIQGHQHQHRSHRPNLDSCRFSSKRPRVSNSFDCLIPPVDFISTLPDYLIQEILSFLPIEEAVRTCVLSQRWKPLWTQMPTLCFNHNCFPLKLVKFAEFVNKTLQQFTAPKVKEFTINFKFTDSIASSLENWVLFATTHHAEKLSLVFNGGLLYAPFAESTPYRLPQFFYRNSSLTDLTLRQCDVWLDSTHVLWPSLKVLSINYSKLNNDAIEKILSGSPNLQELKLHICEGITRICSLSLQVLVIDGIYGADDKDECVTEISCPNLQSLSLLGYMYKRTYKLMHVLCLSKANLSFVTAIDRKDKYDCTKHRYILRELLEKLGGVEKLTVGTWCLEVLSIWKIKGISSPLSTRNCLVLDTEICEWDLPGIVSLLQSSPYLKKLVINLFPHDNSKGFFNSYAFSGVKFLTSADWISKCFLQSLETIEITGFQPSYTVCKLLVELMEFLLKNATVLKKVLICGQNHSLFGFWEFSELDRHKENAMREQIRLTLSKAIPKMQYSST